MIEKIQIKSMPENAEMLFKVPIMFEIFRSKEHEQNDAYAVGMAVAPQNIPNLFGCVGVVHQLISGNAKQAIDKGDSENYKRLAQAGEILGELMSQLSGDMVENGEDIKIDCFEQYNRLEKENFKFKFE